MACCTAPIPPGLLSAAALQHPPFTPPPATAHSLCALCCLLPLTATELGDGHGRRRAPWQCQHLPALARHNGGQEQEQGGDARDHCRVCARMPSGGCQNLWVRAEACATYFCKAFQMHSWPSPLWAARAVCIEKVNILMCLNPPPSLAHQGQHVTC